MPIFLIYNVQCTIDNCGKPIYTTPFVPYGDISPFKSYGLKWGNKGGRVRSEAPSLLSAPTFSAEGDQRGSWRGFYGPD